jgi:hypothetical protein
MYGGRKGNLKLSALCTSRACKEEKRDKSLRRYGSQEFHICVKNGDCGPVRLRNILTNTPAHAGVACTQPPSVVTVCASLKRKLQGKLDDSRINNRGSSGIRPKKVNRVIQEISDRIGKLRVIEGIEEFRPKL